ncbi:hypothetical protein [Pseudomonas anguilliseptica]|uniref:hypothetical protein n=1 Tax=Pseudomonas anguilliseptica TaxID=53406 RepID=UPI00325BE4DD
MLTILRLAVLPHKHPHELLDSVVKERLVKPFASTEARILQQPHLASSYFSKFFLEKFFLLNHLHYNLSALALIAQNFMLVLIVKPPTVFTVRGFDVGA